MLKLFSKKKKCEEKRLRACLRGDTVGDPKRDLYAVIHGKGISKREFKQMKKEYNERGDIE